ncbi:hypothetical protein ACA910_021190 [Epithemia clementina (nom. ined.)]
MAHAAAKEDNNAKLDEELEMLARELEEPDIVVNCQKELMTLMVDKTVDNAAIKIKLTMEEEESSAIGTTPSSEVMSRPLLPHPLFDFQVMTTTRRIAKCPQSHHQNLRQIR